MAMTADEFLRRFLLHVLPRGFVRIGHFGFLSAPRRRASIVVSRRLLRRPSLDCFSYASSNFADLTRPCPCCGGDMIILEKPTARQIRLRSAQ